MDKAIIVIIALVRPANKKLAKGCNNKLATAMGMENTKRERPLDISSGVSLKTRATVRSSRNNEAATRLDRRLTK